jgi:hypothetical protein
MLVPMGFIAHIHREFCPKCVEKWTHVRQEYLAKAFEKFIADVRRLEER